MFCWFFPDVWMYFVFFLIFRSKKSSDDASGILSQCHLEVHRPLLQKPRLNPKKRNLDMHLWVFCGPFQTSWSRNQNPFKVLTMRRRNGNGKLSAGRKNGLQKAKHDSFSQFYWRKLKTTINFYPRQTNRNNQHPPIFLIKSTYPHHHSSRRNKPNLPCSTLTAI